MKRYRTYVLLLLPVACASTPRTQTPRSASASLCDSVTWAPKNAPERITVAGRSAITLFVERAPNAVAGRTTHANGQSVFRPHWPLVPGLRYRVKTGYGCETTFAVPAATSTALARVVQIYPVASTLPENILRFYVYFSQPMAEGGFIEHIRLTHVESGEDLSGVFFDNIYELWSTDRTRITLLVDPGRVKTGLRAHRQQGRAFRAGQSYRLQVRATWRTIDGRPLDAGLTKTFRATTEVSRPIDLRHWRLSPPATATRSPLRIDFPVQIDHVAMSHFAHVYSSADTPLRGQWRLSQGQRRAEWTPAEPWPTTERDYRLSIDSRLEDVVGNNLQAAFDHEVGAIKEETAQHRAGIRFQAAVRERSAKAPSADTRGDDDAKRTRTSSP